MERQKEQRRDQGTGENRAVPGAVHGFAILYVSLPLSAYCRVLNCHCCQEYTFITISPNSLHMIEDIMKKAIYFHLNSLKLHQDQIYIDAEEYKPRDIK